MNRIGEYEGDLWVVINEEGIATHALKSKPSLEEMQGFVGGLIEYAPVVEGATAPLPINMNEAKLSQVVSVIVDEEGLHNGKTMNPTLCMIAGHPFLVGTGVICGGVDHEGYNLGLPKTLANVLRDLSNRKSLSESTA